ncbi:MAG: hypothetical protein WAX69_17075 [Victivallales bacterium]
MKITEEIFQALRKAVFEAGSQASFADRAMVSKQNIHRYLKRKVNCIDDDKWEKLEPLLKPHMPRKEINLEDLNPDERILLEKYRELSNLQKKNILEKTMEEELSNRISHFRSAAGE